MSTETIDDGTVYLSKDGKAVIVATDQVWLVDGLGIQKSGTIYWEVADEVAEPLESRQMRAAADVTRAFIDSAKLKDIISKRAAVATLVQKGMNPDLIRSLGYGEYLSKQATALEMVQRGIDSDIIYDLVLQGHES